MPQLPIDAQNQEFVSLLTTAHGKLLGYLLTIVLFAPSFLAAAPFEEVIEPFLKEHCVRCHGEKKQRGDLRLDTLAADFDSGVSAGQWIEVMDNLNLGEMPPDDEPQPAAADHQAVVTWIANELRSARQRAVGSGGAILLRRLNRSEYSNTLRDLLRINYLPGEDPTELLPPDATWEGFDKVGSTLMLDPSLLNSYYEVAKSVSSRLMVDGPPEWPTKGARFEFERTGNSGEFDYVMNSIMLEATGNTLQVTGGTTRLWDLLNYPGADNPFPVTGRYTLRVRAWAEFAEDQDPPVLIMDRINGREPRLIEAEVGREPKVFEITRSFVALGDIRPQSYFAVGIRDNPPNTRTSSGFSRLMKAAEEAAKTGDFGTNLRLQARMLSEGYVDYTRPTEVLLNLDQFPKIHLDWIEIAGPLYEAWPPASHTNLLFREGAEENESYAREIFARLLPRAYRRPVQESEIDRVTQLVAAELASGTDFQEALQVGLNYVLTTPDFLYLIEPRSDDAGRPLHDYELALRLSYFLWSSMPDDELFEVAASGRLRQQLPVQIERMLADPKARALTEGFARQWLRTDDYHQFLPDRKIYRDFDPQLRDDMVEETLTFFEEILTKRQSIFEFLDSDFTMVNQPLAEFYGFSPIKGDEFQRVKLPADSPRGGLLGHAGIHLAGSDGIRTKPVTRGVWIREVLFNDPPLPPPPNAGEVEPNIKGERLTVRQRLEQHQQIEACASCHRGIDPWGLALENFDATGAWRDRQNGEEFRGEKTPTIDASGRLPNGDEFADFEEFKSLLLKQDDRFRRAFAEKFFVYAIGRPIEPSDRGQIDDIMAALATNGDTIPAAIHALTKTESFLTK